MLIALVVVVVGFVSIGLVRPQLSYESQIVVAKPVAEAWAVMQDEDKMPDWLPGFQKIEHLSGTPGTVGAVSNVHFIEDGEPMVIKETITAIAPNESISMSYTSDLMDMDYPSPASLVLFVPFHERDEPCSASGILKKRPAHPSVPQDRLGGHDLKKFITAGLTPASLAYLRSATIFCLRHHDKPCLRAFWHHDQT